jgi:hypothetical protein
MLKNSLSSQNVMWEGKILMEIEEVVGLGVYQLVGGKRIPILYPDELYANKVDPTKAKIVYPTPDVLESIIKTPVQHMRREDEPDDGGGPKPWQPKPLPSGRFEFDFESQVEDAPSHRMHTKGAVNSSNGYVTATTRTWTWTKLGGFHGSVMLGFFDKEQIALGGTDYERFGVDGGWLGQSDRTDFWQTTFDPGKAPQIEYMIVVHTWRPDEVKVAIQKAADILEPAANVLGKLDQIGTAISGLYTKFFK